MTAQLAALLILAAGVSLAGGLIVADLVQAGRARHRRRQSDRIRRTLSQEPK